MSDDHTLYLTTPIYYVNAAPHLGHAYTTIVTDAMARYRRLAGDRVWFLTGTDEHGDNIAQVAAAAGMTPQAYADTISAAFHDAWRRLGITNDDFIRTTEGRHRTVVQRVLQTLYDAGEIYRGTYGGHYCFRCERFYTDKEIVDGKCPDHQVPLTYIEEENYFFKMSRYQSWLVGYLEAHPTLIRPERYRNEILGFLRDPLQDLSISRPRQRLAWGIPLPFDDQYVTYVWFDALLNYVSALGDIFGEKFRTFWPHVEHVIGKDILKQHAIYWPCMLKAAGLPIYQRLNVHGYWTLGGGKMSKSIGNVVEALALTDKYGNDAFRYFVMREMAFGLDADFSEEAFVGRLNADLANDLGNLASRASTLLVSLRAGVVPAAPTPPPSAASTALRETFIRTQRETAAAMDEFALHRALAALWEFVRAVNRYVDSRQPWTLAKEPVAVAALDETLHDLGQALWCLGVVLEPFLPDAARTIRRALGDTSAATLARASWGALAPGTKVNRITNLFPRVDGRTPKATPAPSRRTPRAAGTPGAAGTPDARTPGAAGRITIDDLAKVDLRVAEVVAAEVVAKSRKLLKLTVSLGGEQRTVVAGIAEHYAPSDLVGKKVVVVANLEPAQLMGLESQGMLLAGTAGAALGVLVVDRDLPAGARIT